VFTGTGPRFDAKNLSTEGSRVREAMRQLRRLRPSPPTPVRTLQPASSQNAGISIRSAGKLDADAEARTRAHLPLLFDFFGRETKAFDFTKGLGEVSTLFLILGRQEGPVMPPAY
jgi:hypothetical protein